MRRSILIALIALLALVVAAPLAFAQSRGGGAPEPIPDEPFTLEGARNPVGAQCTFDVFVEPSGSTKEIDVPERRGEAERTIFIFPAAMYTLTNEDTGEQVTLNVTGASHQTTLENGDVVTVVTGLNLLGDPQAGFVLAQGDFSFTFDAEGNLTEPLHGTGQLTDVCALLS